MIANQTVHSPTSESDPAPNVPREVQQQILRAVAAVHYGSIEVVIQNGVVVQIESRAKQRIKIANSASSS